MDIKELKQQAKTLEPVLRIGKFGLTDNVHVEVEKLLKKRRLIKIKILNNCPLEDKDDLINKVVAKSQTVLVSKIGGIFIIYRERKPFYPRNNPGN
jgi:RNA-binding protein